MRSKYFLAASFLLSGILLQAQSPQFAVVRPDGTTYICPTLDSAYNRAASGDYIYLPGGSFSFTNPVNKKIFIYGAGCNPDSSQVTNNTIISGITLQSGASEGSISGCYLNVYCYSGCSPAITFSDNVNNYRISYCYINSGIKFDSTCTGIVITNNIIGAYGNGCLYGGSFSIQLQGSNNLIANNFIAAVVSSYGGNIYSNNIFPYCQQFCGSSLSCNGELFENNIFNCASTGVSNSIFRNNIGRYNGIDGQNNQGTDNFTIGTPIDSLFINFIQGYSSPTFWGSNLHLRANSPYLTGGTNGTQLGIFGGAYPTYEGWVPSNPHIYFKQVAPATNTNGQLPVQFKVRTNN